ncbi:hypothetical protein M5689_001673 [Euphorbia peplus]|nr:hypothetical protein M5689_001673 [Euphorbia peplus]
MENEVLNLVKVWSSVMIFLWLSYGIGLLFPKGIKRLFLILPTVALFPLLHCLACQFQAVALRFRKRLSFLRSSHTSSSFSSPRISPH